jgi:hypothetical protein
MPISRDRDDDFITGVFDRWVWLSLTIDGIGELVLFDSVELSARMVIP